MASSGNFPLWSPLFKGASNLTLGNTRFDGTTNSRSAMTSFAVPTGTKFYIECLVTHATNYNIIFGLANPDVDLASYIETDSSMNGILFRGNTASSWDTCSLTNGSRGSFGSNVGQTSARVLAMTVNRVDDEIKMYLDNSLKHTISISATEVYHIVCTYTGGGNSAIHMNINGGHDSTGAGDFSAGSATDENGFGNFQNAPASGFLAPSSANLPISDDIDPAQTDDDIPEKQFGVVTYSGTGTTGNAITGLGFQPDLLWLKHRNATSDYSNALVDSSRGRTKVLYSHDTRTERTSPANKDVASFDSDGFTVDVSEEIGINSSTGTYVAWCWKANGGTTTSFSSSGNQLAGTYQANTKSKFSIITYTGSGSTGEVLHGMGATPNFILSKDRGVNYGWNVFHKSDGVVNSGYSGQVYLDSNNDLATNQQVQVVPDSTKITMAGNEQINKSTNTYIMYAWADVEGYQKFGAYKANGNVDGPLIYTGFRPRLLFVKNLEHNSTEWQVRDTAVNTFNPADTGQFWDQATAEATNEKYDILANGFKIRTQDGAGNFGSGSTIIYGAWADVPFKYNNTHP